MDFGEKMRPRGVMTAQLIKVLSPAVTKSHDI